MTQLEKFNALFEELNNFGFTNTYRPKLKDFNLSGYPYFNIMKIDDNTMILSIAVAGFSKDELSVYKEGGILYVEGTKRETEEIGSYVYQGISNKGFRRAMSVAKNVEISNVKLEAGIINITLSAKENNSTVEKFEIN